MRIVGGKKRGKRLAQVTLSHIRPTSDKVREAIFNVLGQELPEVNVLDIFAGTGAMGIEALSRGAKKAVFIDSSKESAALIKKNLELSGFSALAKVVTADALKALKALNGEVFELVFVDAPYADIDAVSAVLKELKVSDVLFEEAMVVCEVASKEADNVAIEGYVIDTRKKYGDTTVFFLRIEA